MTGCHRRVHLRSLRVRAPTKGQPCTSGSLSLCRSRCRRRGRSRDRHRPLADDAAGGELQPRGSTTRGSRSPGTRYVYTGVKDGKPSRDVVTVTRRTRTIAGRPVRRRRATASTSRPARGAHDRLVHARTRAATSGTSARTTAELDRHGRVTSTEGTWQAGVDGAQAGIYMPAAPAGRPDADGRSSYKGHAEDHFRVIGLLPQPRARPRRRTPSSPANGRRSSRARSTTNCTYAASAPSSSKQSAAVTSTSSSCRCGERRRAARRRSEAAGVGAARGVLAVVDPRNFIRRSTTATFRSCPAPGSTTGGWRRGPPQTDDMFVTHRFKYVLGVRAPSSVTRSPSREGRSSGRLTGTPRTDRETSGTWGRTRSS